ncbi:MAG: CehA/McbA family metallohydrolase [Myxococcota bacterium]|nr:CehA/McbA family metallohydrolase [Myxococcota bacterium]
MTRAVLGCSVASMLVLALAADAHAQVLSFEGEVPEEGDYFVIPFEVPAGIAEIEIRHDDLSEVNILDWGVIAPSGFRGYGGGNVEPAVLNAEAASRSYLPGPIEVGTWLVYVGKAKIEERPARYAVEVELRAEATLAPEPERAPYAPVAALSSEARWYAGDFHVHSRESGDAPVTLEEIADYAESIGLDFVMLSDHNTVSQLEHYAALQAAHPDLLFVPGIEVTTYQGHALSIGGTEWIDHRLGYEGRTIDQVADEVHADGALFAIAHPSLSIGDACIGCGWMAMLGGDDLDAMEIQTGAFSVTGSLFFNRTLTRWEDLAAAGHRVVAIGGSDDHRAGTGTGPFDSPIGSPTTLVFAQELSASAILEGLRLGRTVIKLESPDDPMIEITSPDLSSGDGVIADYVTVRVRVTGAAMGATLQLVRSGVAGAPIDVVGDPFEHEEIVVAGAGEEFFRAQLSIGGRPRVVTNHFFVSPATAGGADGGGMPDAGAETGGGEGCACGVTSTRGSTAGAAFVLLGVLVIVALRRVRR